MTIQNLSIRLLASLCFVLFSFGLHAATNESTPPQGPEIAPGLQGPTPDPALAPDQIVRIQLQALRENNDADDGIAVCFRFASPNNQSNTGPVDRFGQMIKMGPYRLMLDYYDAHYAEIEIRNNKARQLVTLKGTRETITYAFYLSRQILENCNGCWMTDAVTIEKVEKTLSAKHDSASQIEI